MIILKAFGQFDGKNKKTRLQVLVMNKYKTNIEGPKNSHRYSEILIAC